MREGRGAGPFFVIKPIAMVYQLVAWTDKGQVKMLPELLREYAQPYIDRIETLQAFYDEGWDDGLGRLTEQDVIALSRSYEAYGRFLRAHGKRQEAFEAFTDAAGVCLDDRFRTESEFGDVLVGTLPKRFHYAKSFCQEMIAENPALAQLPMWQRLLERFRELDAPFAEERRMVQQQCRANRAYYFGCR